MSTVKATEHRFVRDAQVAERPSLDVRTQIAEGYTYGPHGIVTAPDGRTASHGFHYAMDEPCGGVSIAGADPGCCETHMLPWGHNRRPSS